MSLKRDSVSAVDFDPQPQAYKPELVSDALGQWAEITPYAATGNTIDMFEQIGGSWDGSGVTAQDVANRLGEIQGPVTVRVNSPGGDLFEGLAIYNLLLAHEAKVTVQVMGIAASAASIIAMAADELTMGPASMLMIHNAWGLVIGNRNDMRDAADVFEKFDNSMAKLYAERSGKSQKMVASMMDAETFMEAEEAVAEGFADRVDRGLKAAARLNSAEADAILAKRRVEAALAKDGVPAGERLKIMQSTGAVKAAPPPNEGQEPIVTPTQLEELKALLTL
ncbi:MAG: head maturation protease, ClpP-related [Pseudomonadota bacterium]